MDNRYVTDTQLPKLKVPSSGMVGEALNLGGRTLVSIKITGNLHVKYI